jgi:DNA-directed RNA polymerase specialized sigma24 family protein
MQQTTVTDGVWVGRGRAVSGAMSACGCIKPDYLTNGQESPISRIAHVSPCGPAGPFILAAAVGLETPIATRTTTRLLDALHDTSNELAWSHIDARYRPVIVGLARRLGLRDSEADEVGQQTLSEFVRAYRERRYDRAKGRLSSWILGIAHHTALKSLRNTRRDGSATALEHVPASPDEPHLRSIWTDERDRCILERALGMLRDESAVDDRTLLAFELVGLRAVPAAQAAEQCGMSVDQVYVAKNRVTKRLRSLVAELTEAFEADS